jgi:hypothetical protein
VEEGRIICNVPQGSFDSHYPRRKLLRVILYGPPDTALTTIAAAADYFDISAQREYEWSFWGLVPAPANMIVAKMNFF